MLYIYITLGRSIAFISYHGGIFTSGVISAIDFPTLLASSLVPRPIRHFISCEVASPDIKWRMGLGTRLTS